LGDDLRRGLRQFRPQAPLLGEWWVETDFFEEDTMGKTGRKRRARKKKAANHGKRPNA
jgi:hypothetical protein